MRYIIIISSQWGVVCSRSSTIFYVNNSVSLFKILLSGTTAAFEYVHILTVKCGCQLKTRDLNSLAYKRFEWKSCYNFQTKQCNLSKTSNISKVCTNLKEYWFTFLKEGYLLKKRMINAFYLNIPLHLTHAHVVLKVFRFTYDTKVINQLT